MPELPDVQVFKEYADATALHQRIEHVHLHEKRLLDDVSSSTLRRHLGGRRLSRSRRHGKQLFLYTDRDGALRLHFGMSGELSFWKGPKQEPNHTALRLDFSNGHRLAYISVRKLGAIGWVPDVEHFIEAHGLGPDALGLDLATFRGRLEQRRATVKSTLMNQRVIAGIGNIYADEILFRAGVRPTRRVATLHDAALKRIHAGMQRVLTAAITARGDPDRMPNGFLLPHRDPQGRCPHCGRTLRRTRVAGRATYYCSHDQR